MVSFRIGIDANVLTKLHGGISTYLFYLLKELIPQRPNDLFYLYTFSDDGDIAYFKQYPNVVIRKVPFFSFGRSIWLQTLIAFRCWKDNIDLFWGPVQAIPLIKSKKMKTILTLHDFTYLLYPHTMTRKKAFFFKLFSYPMFKKADRILSVSHGTGERLLQLYGLKADLVIHPPLKPEMRRYEEQIITPLLQASGLKFGCYIVSVGTIEPRKNFKEMVEVYFSILEEEGVERVLPLVIIGSGGWKNKEILQTLHRAQERYPSHIKLLSQITDEELPFYLSGAKWYVTFSHYEGYGMPIAEARACGTQIACPDSPEMREAAENDGLFFSQENKKEQFRNLCRAADPAEKKLSSPVTDYQSNKEKSILIGQLIDRYVK